jgi:hypothetical protein
MSSGPRASAKPMAVLGMAAPFLAVAAAPGVVACLPRPGPWMVRLQRALGLALLGCYVRLSRCRRSYSPVGVLRLCDTAGHLGAVLRSPHRQHSRGVAPDPQPIVIVVCDGETAQPMQARAEEPLLPVSAPRFPRTLANARRYELARQCHARAVARDRDKAAARHNGPR